MKLLVNGEEREVPSGATVAELVAALAGPAARGVAVALDREVVPRAAWPETRLEDGQELEVLRAAAGG